MRRFFRFATADGTGYREVTGQVLAFEKKNKTLEIEHVEGETQRDDY